MKKKLVVILIMVGLLIIIVAIGYYWWWQNQPENMIVIKDTPEGKLVINRKEGISMKVPEGWKVKKYISDEVLEIQKFGPKQIIDTELQDGVVMEVYIQLNPQRLNIKEFATQNWDYSKKELKFSEINGKETIKTVDKMSYAADENDKPIYLEKSRVVDISFAKNKKVYIFSCTSVGQNYKKYSAECEEVIKDKIRNEF